MSKEVTLEVAGHPHKHGDVLYINGDRYVVTKMQLNPTSSKVYLTPISEFITGSTYLSQALPYIVKDKMTIADYVNILCNEYESNCTC